MAAPRTSRRGITFVEVIVAVAIVGGLFAATMNVVGAGAAASRVSFEQALAHRLADELVGEIVAQPFVDPAGLLTDAIGYGPGEFDGTRSGFDDVDDYIGWSASPPQKKDGTVMTAYASWRRTVDVVWARADLPSVSSHVPSLAKRITVRVYRDGRLISTASVLRYVGFDRLHEGRSW